MKRNKVDKQIEQVKRELIKHFPVGICAIILYGSWARGNARVDSDIDLLVIVKRDNKKIRTLIYDLMTNFEVSIVLSTASDFAKEKWPVFTAAKKDGKVIYGNIDMSMDPQNPEVKYADFFKRSREFEIRKIKLAQTLSQDGMTSGVIDNCFVASKHALQASLAMKGKGFSSKIDVLLPLTKEYFGRDIASKFKKLHELYVKYEGHADLNEIITKKETVKALELARGIVKVYEIC